MAFRPFIHHLGAEAPPRLRREASLMEHPTKRQGSSRCSRGAQGWQRTDRIFISTPSMPVVYALISMCSTQVEWSLQSTGRCHHCAGPILLKPTGPQSFDHLQPQVLGGQVEESHVIEAFRLMQLSNVLLQSDIDHEDYDGWQLPVQWDTFDKLLFMLR